MESMDQLWTPWTYKNLNKHQKRLNGVHGFWRISMESMDSRRLVQQKQNEDQLLWTPWTMLVNFKFISVFHIIQISNFYLIQYTKIVNYSSSSISSNSFSSTFLFSALCRTCFVCKNSIVCKNQLKLLIVICLRIWSQPPSQEFNCSQAF